jgi:hypothetical protein
MKRRNEDKEDEGYEPKSLNFDYAEKRGVSDHLKEPYMTDEDLRGDNEDDQYYEEEEAISPEEAMLRKEEEEKGE